MPIRIDGIRPGSTGENHSPVAPATTGVISPSLHSSPSTTISTDTLDVPAIRPSDTLTSHPFLGSFERELVSTAAGPVELPLLIGDAEMVGLSYLVSGTAASGLVNHPDLEVVKLPRLFGGSKAVAMLTAFAYREGTLSPYNEIGLQILVRPRGKFFSKPFFYVVALPVTTQEASDVGSIWNYPKYVDTIDIHAQSNARTVTSGEGVRLEIPDKEGLQLPHVDSQFASGTTGAPVTLSTPQTPPGQKMHLFWGSGGSVDLNTGASGPLADAIRTLALPSKRPFLGMRVDQLTMAVGTGEDLVVD
jgi:hypothetical protein